MAATQEEILKGLAEIVNETTGIPIEEVTLDKSFTYDLDIDESTMAEVVAAAVDRFDVEIPEESVKTLQTVGDLAGYILKNQT
ncbi:acyl carrier protein [Nocardia sp. ET3-3]|uniref:Acyl carrier protein n=1 Tax=Nocardia terrae TaxID=2675851 RepID=A0A7K1V637_9NOCA|nr:acyl carrier protein [Nocardia terrae]